MTFSTLARALVRAIVRAAGTDSTFSANLPRWQDRSQGGAINRPWMSSRMPKMHRMDRMHQWAFAGFATCLLAACSAGKKAEDAPAAGHVPAQAAEAPAGDHGSEHWTYNDQAAWAAQSAEAAVCAAGKAQSPIALATEALVDLPNLVGSYAAAEGMVFNNGHTIQIKAAPGQTLNIGSDVYQLVQAHFHAPSEHQIDGKTAPMEVHLVHKNEAGKLAVLGALIEEGTESAQIAQIWAAIPKEPGEANARPVAFDPVALLPEDQTYFAYSGSLTTPPCSEGVRWSVLSKPITASADQIAAFRKIVGENARKIQDLNGRELDLGR